MAQIVVVEDEAELAAAIAARLRSDGHVVSVAADGPRAPSPWSPRAAPTPWSST